MPEPDPEGIDYGDEWPERVSVLTYRPLWGGNKRHRMARAKAILARLLRDRWACRWCWQSVPLFRRADARYCCEGCRKRSARSRRKAGER